MAEQLTADIRIVVVDDHTIFRQGLIAVLEPTADIEVVGESGDGAGAVETVKRTRPDIVLMDIHMPHGNGIEATRQIAQRHPDTAVVMLTMLEDDDSLFAAMAVGARGYLLKGADADEVLRTVRAAAAGQALFGSPIAERLSTVFRRRDTQVRAFPELTDREHEVLDLIARGLDNAAIAARLTVSGKTVSNHVSAIFAKLQVVDRAQAIVRAREAGLGGTEDAGPPGDDPR